MVFCASSLEAADQNALPRVSREEVRWNYLGEQKAFLGQTDKKVASVGLSWRARPAAPGQRQQSQRTQARSRAGTHPHPHRRVPKPRPTGREAPPRPARAGLRGGPAARHQQSILSGGGFAALRGNRHVSGAGRRRRPAAASGASGRMAEASERLYRVEYAKSGRASCKKCSESIPKDSLRMAIMVQVRRGRAGGAGRRGHGGCAGSGRLTASGR